jgi:hypothetical protein
MTKRPMIAFYPGSELNDDPTNWRGPNRAVVEAMLKTVGFSRAEMVPQGFRFNPGYRIARAIKHKLIDRESFWGA